MDDQRKQTLGRLAFSRSKEPGRLLTKTQAIDDLWREFRIERGTKLWDRVHEELLFVANSRAESSFHGRRAVQMALRLLDDLENDREEQWPSQTPDAPAGPGWWPYCCTPAHHGQEAWRQLDEQGATQGQRDAWRKQIEGPPPWRHPPESEASDV